MVATWDSPGSVRLNGISFLKGLVFSSGRIPGLDLAETVAQRGFPISPRLEGRGEVEYNFVNDIG